MSEEIITVVALAALIVLVFLAAFHFYLYYGVIKILKTKYPEVWDGLGKPESGLLGSMQSKSDFWKYIKKSQYKVLNDLRISRQASILKQVNVFYLVFFIVMFIGFTLVFISS